MSTLKRSLMAAAALVALPAFEAVSPRGSYIYERPVSRLTKEEQAERNKKRKAQRKARRSGRG